MKSKYLAYDCNVVSHEYKDDNNIINNTSYVCKSADRAKDLIDMLQKPNTSPLNEDQLDTFINAVKISFSGKEIMNVMTNGTDYHTIIEEGTKLGAELRKSVLDGMRTNDTSL